MNTWAFSKKKKNNALFIKQTPTYLIIVLNKGLKCCQTSVLKARAIRSTYHSFRDGTHESDFARRRTSNKLLPSNYIESANFFPHQILNLSSRPKFRLWQRDFGLPLCHNRDNESSPGKRNYIDRFVVTYVTSSNFVPFFSSTWSFLPPAVYVLLEELRLVFDYFSYPVDACNGNIVSIWDHGFVIGNVCKTYPRSFLSPIQRKVSSACVFRFLILGYDPRNFDIFISYTRFSNKRKRIQYKL